MLKSLNIHEFIIIEDLALTFKPGITVLTGETGAGKSILLDALGLILGDVGEADLIRAGSKDSFVRALFEAGTKHPVWKSLTPYDIEIKNDILIERVLDREGRNDTLVNGKPVPIEIMKDVGYQLCEIHGQFANQSILDPNKQLELLDLVGGYRVLLEQTAKAWWDLKGFEKSLDEERKFMANSAAERDFLSKAVAELKALRTMPGEFEKMDAEYNELVRIRTINEMLQSIQSQLVAGTGAQRLLVSANRVLEKQKNLDPEVLENLVKHMSACLASCHAASDELLVVMPKFEFDAEHMHKVEDRLNKFDAIAEKHEVAGNELPELLIRLDAKLQRILKAPEFIKELEDKVMVAKGEYARKAQALSEARKRSAKDLSEQITAEMPPLKLNRAQFIVEVSELPSNRWSHLGMNEVLFTARINPGMPFTTIAKTASGGELARMILALKVIVQRVQSTETLIFDEIDTGLGGPTASAVGERLARLSDQTQVFVITHSPQVAARGEQHMKVEKTADNKTTTSNVLMLTEEERFDEIARMLAGEEITPEAKAAAQSLMREAARAAVIRRKEMHPERDIEAELLAEAAARAAASGAGAGDSAAH